MKNEPGLNFRSCLCPPLVPLAFKASFLRLFLIYTEPEEWVIADQKTGLFCYPIKNTHGDNVLPVPPCDHRGSTNALGFAHLDAHVGVGISKLEVGSHRWYNKRQFFSFIIIIFFFFLSRVLVVVQASCSGALISSWSHSDKPFVSDEGFVDIYVPGERIFYLFFFYYHYSKQWSSHRDRNGSQMDYLFCVCLFFDTTFIAFYI